MPTTTTSLESNQVHQFQGRMLDAKKFIIELQGFAYCSVSDWQNGQCPGTQQFTPGKAPLHIWMAYSTDPVFVGQEIDIALIFQTAANEPVWNIDARIVLKYAEGLVSVSFDEDPGTPTPAYPAELKNIQKGRYLFIASMVTTDGANYAERTLPIIIR